MQLPLCAGVLSACCFPAWLGCLQSLVDKQTEGSFVAAQQRNLHPSKNAVCLRSAATERFSFLNFRTSAKGRFLNPWAGLRKPHRPKLPWGDKSASRPEIHLSGVLIPHDPGCALFVYLCVRVYIRQSFSLLSVSLSLSLYIYM